MKKLILLALVIITFFSGCVEIVPEISTEFTYTGRRVLIEEFTGVQCVNCPEGSKKIEELVALHGDNLIPISIHAGDFSDPYPESLYDFNTPEGEILERSHLGPVIGFPIAVVNRRQFDSENDVPVVLRTWAGHITTELFQQPKLEVSIDNNFDETSRELTVDVTLNFAETVTDGLVISIMVLENDIVDYQLTPDGKQSDYVHKHVLRTMLTDYQGEAIASNQTVSGQKPEFTYTFTVPAEWNAENCSVVAFVSKDGSGTDGALDVLQANVEDF
jgi:hypothetical protein